MENLKVNKVKDEVEISIEYNDISEYQTTESDANISSKTIQPEVTQPHKLLAEEMRVLHNKYVKSKYKLLQNETSKIEATISDNSDSLPVIQVKHSKAFTKTSIQCTNIASDATQIISKGFAQESTQATNTKVSVNSVGSLNPTESRNPTLKHLISNSSKELPESDYTRPRHPLHFSGARFMQAQVHSNSVLQSLLKDIISLNNEKDVVDEDIISREVASLRAKNNLPSLNPEVAVNFELEDSDFSEGSEDESYCYYNSKSSENYGKDSGYDNESQHSESLEDDTISKLQDNSKNATGKSFVLTEPEYIDLDKYFDSKRRTITRASLTDIKTITKSPQQRDDSINNLRANTLTCSICNKTLMSKRTYRKHTKNGTGCIKTPDEKKKVGQCNKFLGRKEAYFIHKKEKHLMALKDKAVPVTCEKCPMSFSRKMSLDMHYKTRHKPERCPFCDFVCENLTEYNLHISSKHIKRAKKDSTSSDSDCLQIVEIE